jgi:hypothetical protein
MYCIPNSIKSTLNVLVGSDFKKCIYSSIAIDECGNLVWWA